MAEAVVQVPMVTVVDPELGDVTQPKYLGVHFGECRTVEFKNSEADVVIYVQASDAELTALAAEPDVTVL